jgi:hypothetical protein
MVSVEIPPLPSEHLPPMGREEDSVSTFYPGPTINLTEELDQENGNTQPLPVRSPTGILRTPRNLDSDAVSRISTLDSITRISSLESNISAMEKAFKEEICKLQHQAVQQAKAQPTHGSMLTEILSMLKQTNIANEASINPKKTEVANLPQTEVAGDSSGVAGMG